MTQEPTVNVELAGLQMDLDFNLSNLENECRQHSQRAFTWGVHLADAKKTTKRAKNAVKLLAAEIGKAARLTPSEFCLDKTTEKAIEECVLMQPNYQAAQENQIEAEHREDVIKAYVEALVDRKTGMQDSVKLYGQTYWSKPQITQEDSEHIRVEQMKATSSNLTRSKKGK